MSAAARPRTIDLPQEPDFTLGGMRVRPSLREVWAGTEREVLEPRVMQVLVALARERGSVVTASQLLESCWAGRVVGDDAVQRCIARVRRLCESHGGAQLETIARVGYRLTETATQAASASAPVSVPGGDAAAPRDEPAATPPRRRLVLPVIGLIAVFAAAAGIGAWQWQRMEAARAAGQQAIDRVAALVAQDRYGEAFLAARPLRADPALKDDPRLSELWRKSVSPMRPRIAETGARVEFKPYGQPESARISAGESPFREWIDAPIGALEVRVTKPGFRTAEFVIANPGPSVESPRPLPMASTPVPLPLVKEGELSAEWVLVPHTDMPVTLTGWSTQIMGGDRYDIPAFAIGRAEVSNREFKEFVDAGGYDDARWWQGFEFREAGRSVPWSVARTRFVDSTRRPGPAHWQLSSYLPGTAELPVGGISWYEAAAYSRFRGAMLPTIHHWLRAALSPYNSRAMTSPDIALRSRFSADGPLPANDPGGLGPWGTHHMLGNVREWVWNRAGDAGLALGGAWSDYYAHAQIAYTADPMARLPQYGLRLMRPLGVDPIDARLLEPTRAMFDGQEAARPPVSDEAFEAMRFQFTTHHRAPVAVTARVVRETELWIAEEIQLTFDPPDAMTLYLVKPRRGGRASVVLYGPPADCCFARRPNRDILEQLRVNEFIVDGGRALVMPIWRGSYETYQGGGTDLALRADAERTLAIRWQQELASVLDYLQVRPDIDASHAGYFGVSQGAAYAVALNLALEPRIKAAVLVSGGLNMSPTHPLHPMIDIRNYAPRIHIPVMMINGRFDHVYPLEQSQKRLFDLLGARPEQKVHIVLDTGHFAFAPNTIAMHASDWFDKYLGAAR